MPSTPPPLTIAQAARSGLYAYRNALHLVRDDEALSFGDAQTLLSETRTDAVFAILRINEVVHEATVGTTIGERVRISTYCAQLARLVQLGAIGVREVDDATIMLSRIAAAMELMERRPEAGGAA